MKIKKLVCLLLIPFSLSALESEINTIGNIQASSKSLLGPQISSKVDSISVDVGDRVKKGQTLVQLDKRFFEVDLAQKAAALEAAKIDLGDQEKNYMRMQKLWEKPEGETPSIPLKRFEDAKTKYEQAIVQQKQAQENFNRAKLNLEETTISAPFDGVVTKKLVDIGEMIPAQPVTPVIEIQSIRPLYLEFSIPQVYAASIQQGTPIVFEIDGMPLTNNSAKIDLIYPHFDEATRSLKCRAVLNNFDGKIRPGCLARVKIPAQ